MPKAAGGRRSFKSCPRAEAFVARVRDREFVKNVEVLTDLGPV
jgi:hypothetical protein